MRVIGRAIALGAFVAYGLAGCAATPAPDAIATCPMPPDPAVLAALPPVEAPLGDAQRGAALFARECAKCHSRSIAARSSRFFRSYPRLDCPDYLAEARASYLFAVIANGGPAIGRDEAMKPFRKALGEQGLADVIQYLRGLRAGTR